MLFSFATLDSASNVQFPSGARPELYRVDLKGSMPVRVLTAPALYAAWDKGGNRLAFSDQKAAISARESGRSDAAEARRKIADT